MAKYDKDGLVEDDPDTPTDPDRGVVECPRDDDCDWTIREDAAELELAIDIHLANDHGLPWEEPG